MGRKMARSAEPNCADLKMEIFLKFLQLACCKNWCRSGFSFVLFGCCSFSLTEEKKIDRDKNLFLDASTHLYKRVCLSVRHEFSKNPRKRLFSVADDIRLKGELPETLFIHTHTHTHAPACTRTRTHPCARMKSIRWRYPDDERL